MSLSQVARELMAAGVTGDALCDALERVEQAAKPARSKGAERTARWRERHKSSQNVTEPSAPLPPKIYNQTPITPPSNSHSDPRETDLRAEVVQIYAGCGSMHTPDTGLVCVWLAQGRDPSIIAAVLRAKVPNKPSAGLAYFEGAIADAHALPQARAGPNQQRLKSSTKSQYINAFMGTTNDLTEPETAA